MDERLFELFRRHDGVVTRAEALAVVNHDVLDRAIEAKDEITRIFPSIYGLVAAADDPLVRRRAALRYVNNGVLSHLDALALWDLPFAAANTEDTSVHVTVRGDHPQVRVPGLVVHRRARVQRGVGPHRRTKRVSGGPTRAGGRRELAAAGAEGSAGAGNRRGA